MVITRRVHYFTIKKKKNGGLMNVHYSIITYTFSFQ